MLDPAPRDTNIVARLARGHLYEDQRARAFVDGGAAPALAPDSDDGEAGARRSLEPDRQEDDHDVTLVPSRSRSVRQRVRVEMASASAPQPVTEVSQAVHAMLVQNVPSDIAIGSLRARMQPVRANFAGLVPFEAQGPRSGPPAHDLTLSELEVRST